MECNAARVRNRIEKLAEFNATPGQGVTRFTYSEQDRQARTYLIEEIHSAGLNVTTDGVGNLRARLSGKTDGPCVMAGSHIDSVLHGGGFDGIVGAIGALEAVNVLAENKIVPEKPVEIIFFAEEEGSNFNSTMAGSKALVGRYTLEDIKRLCTVDGRSMYDMAQEAGYFPDKMPSQILRAGMVDAMLELHIEQGPVLDSGNIPIGLVTGIFGSRCMQIKIFGQANHAGASPMHLRHDPMVAAAHIIQAVNDATPALSDTLVSTFGQLVCTPGIANCIAGQVTLTLDIRDIREDSMDALCGTLYAQAARQEELLGVKTEIRTLAHSAPVLLSNSIISTLERCLHHRNVPFLHMNSGAVHDSVMLSSVTAVGMIFVPSIYGRSHVPEENTAWKDIFLGCNLLLDSICELAGASL